MASLRVSKLTAERVADFFSVHCAQNGEGWCCCTAWWVPTWEGWTTRTAEQNRALRKSLFARGEFDGYVLYVDESPAGWLQCGPRDRLEKLRTQYRLEPESGTWAVSCVVLVPSCRAQGLAHEFLRLVLEDLARAGVRKVQAFPKRLAPGAGGGEHWRGPESLFRKAGFELERDDSMTPVYCRKL